MSLPSRRNRSSRTPRINDVTPTINDAIPYHTFTSHNWKLPTPAASSRRRKNTPTVQIEKPPKAIPKKTKPKLDSIGFGNDNLRELQRLNTLTKDDRIEVSHIQSQKRHSTKDDSVISNAVTKLRQVFENKHSLRESFLEIDENHDGKVSAQELGTVLTSCGMHLDRHQLNALVNQFNSSKKKQQDLGLNRITNADIVIGTRAANQKHKQRRKRQRQVQEEKTNSSSQQQGESEDGGVQWSVQESNSNNNNNNNNNDNEIGLHYDDFVQLVFVDFKNTTNPNQPNSSSAGRVQYLPTKAGQTVTQLKKLPPKSLQAQKIITAVKEKVRNKIREKRGDSLTHVFRSFDTDKDGTISKIEMEEHISKLLGNTVTAVEIELLLLDLDRDGNGTIDILEFSNLLGDKQLGGRGTSIGRPSTAGNRTSNKSNKSNRQNERKERNGMESSTSSLNSSRNSGKNSGRNSGRISSRRRRPNADFSMNTSRSSRSSNSNSTSMMRPSSAPMQKNRRKTNTMGLTQTPSGSSPTRVDLKADRGAMRRSQSKEYCLPPKNNVKELTFAFKDLYKTKTIPSKFTYTPTYDTSELIVTARQRQMTSSGESIGRANGIATNRSNRSNRKQRNFTSIRSAVGFNFNHEDRQKLKSLNDAKLSRLHKYNDRIETNVVRPTRFAEIEQSDQRVHHLIRQRVDYYTKLQSRFARDRAMQLAAGV